MFGIQRHLLTALITVFSSAAILIGCGGDLEVYNAGGEDTGSSGAGPDMGSSTVLDDVSSPEPDPADMLDEPDPELDMGGGMPDVPTLDMEMPEMPDPEPTTNAPQSGPTVDEQITTQCSTIAVKGLSLQLIDQMNCEDPGIMKSFEGAAGISYGPAVFPFQQGPATDTLTAVAANNGATMPVNSALRTVPQQYLLYEWYQRGLCNANLAASPGRSNHNGGLAIDIGNSSTWRSPMRNASYIDNVSGEPWHFYYSGAGGKDVRSLSVLAFQKLYNRNFPENPIDEDGVYGPQTEGALKTSPANGFTREPVCPAVMAMTAYPHKAPLDVSWEQLGDGVLGISTLAPSGIQLVEYFVDGRLVGFADRDGQRFETVVQLPRTDGELLDLEVVAYDYRGVEKARSVGLVDGGSDDTALFVRPIGGTNYEIGYDELPDGAQSVEVFVDGVVVDQDPLRKLRRATRYRVTVQLDEGSEVSVVLLDERDRVVDIRWVKI